MSEKNDIPKSGPSGAASNRFKDKKDLKAANEVFQEDGYCVFTNLLNDYELNSLIGGVSEAQSAGKLLTRENKMNVIDDAIFAHPAIETLCKHRAIVEIVKTFLGSPVNLQHSKFNAKPMDKNVKAGEVKWHQDFPFFPHTNTDLVACVIHLDDEDEGSGPMWFVPGSHLLGERTHVDSNNNFIYGCPEPDESYRPAELLVAKRGWISFHHALTLHYSGIKTHERDRRLIVFQYRAYDAIQLAGVIWKCNGYHVDDSVPDFPIARFPDGSKIPLRGRGGRLYDLFGALAPNTNKKEY